MACRFGARMHDKVQGARKWGAALESGGVLQDRYQLALTPPAAAYFLRNLSTRPAVSTIFCLPV
jgi:hypothetical protein